MGRSYQQWNPADIWAVKTKDQKSLEDEITQQTENPSVLDVDREDIGLAHALIHQTSVASSELECTAVVQDS